TSRTMKTTYSTTKLSRDQSVFAIQSSGKHTPRFSRRFTMHRTILAALCLCFAAVPADAGVIAMPPPGPVRVEKSDAVVVGKVESIEPADVKAGTTTYRIAVVKISDPIKGVKDAKSLRVGFIPIEKPKPGVF